MGSYMMTTKCDGCGEHTLCEVEEYYDGYCYSCMFEGYVDADGNPIPPAMTKEEGMRSVW